MRARRDGVRGARAVARLSNILGIIPPVEPGTRPAGVVPVRLPGPPEDAILWIVHRGVFPSARHRGEIFQTHGVGGNRCWLHHPPSTGESLSSVGCHGLVGQAMAAVAQRRQVRKLIASAILGTNKMMDGKLRRRTATPT